MFRAFVLLGLVIANCAAYDFKNSDFNEVILERYKGLRIGLGGSVRINRDAENPEDKNEFPGPKCCKEQTNTEANKLLEAFEKQCAKEVYGDVDGDYHYDPLSCEHVEEVRARYVCVAECLGFKYNLIHANGTVNRVLLVAVQKQFTRVGSEWKDEVAAEIADKCISQQEAVKHFAGKCNPTAAWLFFCMWKEYFLACPDELQVKTERCDRLRERMKKQDSPIASGFYSGQALL